jgi:hypothetical protein
VLLLLLPPLLLLPLSFFEELAELRLDPGVLCLAPPGGAEGVGWVAWLLFNSEAAALFVTILLYFEGVSMMGESGEIGMHTWLSRCRRLWGQRHCLLPGRGGSELAESGVLSVSM